MQRRNTPTALQVFRGTCTATEAVGDAVYISGPWVGGLPPVRRADSASWDTMPAVGIIISKPTHTTCYVQQAGILPDGVVGGLTRGKTYKVGTAGALVVSAPLPGVNGYALVQFLGSAMDVDRFHVEPDYQMKVRR